METGEPERITSENTAELENTTYPGIAAIVFGPDCMKLIEQNEWEPLIAGLRTLSPDDDSTRIKVAFAGRPPENDDIRALFDNFGGSDRRISQLYNATQMYSPRPFDRKDWAYLWDEWNYLALAQEMQIFPFETAYITTHPSQSSAAFFIGGYPIGLTKSGMEPQFTCGIVRDPQAVTEVVSRLHTHITTQGVRRFSDPLFDRYYELASLRKAGGDITEQLKIYSYLALNQK